MTDSALPETEEPKPVDWERIEHVYQTEEKLASIAKYYGLTVQKIVAHAQREGWALRYERQQASRLKRTPGNTDPATLRKRLTALVERQIAEIEGRLAEPVESRDHERDARTLSNLTRTLDKLIELKRAASVERAEAKRLREEASGDDGAKADDVLRQDLARRLARIATANTD